MKVVLLNCTVNPSLTDFFILIIEGISDETFENAVVNTSHVNKENIDDVQKLLRDSYFDDDYDVFIYAEDYTNNKDEAIYDINEICQVSKDDIIYVEPSKDYDVYEDLRNKIMNKGEQ